MRALLGPILLLLCVGALSREPIPRGGESGKQPKAQTTEKKESSTPNVRSTKDSPVVVETLSTPKREDQTAHEHYEHHEKPFLDRLLSYATVALVAVTGALAFFTYFLWGATKKLVQETTGIARTELRAYVKMSHIDPGLNIVGPSKITVTAHIKNYGRTPANVTDVLLKLHGVPKGESLADAPEYSSVRPREDAHAFLVAEDQFFHSGEFDLPGCAAAAAGGNITLYLYGYVDYIDRFGARHRAGYARQYNPDLDNRSNYPDEGSFRDRNNLIFVAKPGYNYDRPRKEGEGYDW